MKNLHNRDSEVEPLPQASEGDEGLSWETARGHLTVGLLVLARWTLADKTTHQQVHTLPSILAYAWDTAARTGVHLAVLTLIRAEAVNYRYFTDILMLEYAKPLIFIVCNDNSNSMSARLNAT